MRWPRSKGEAREPPRGPQTITNAGVEQAHGGSGQAVSARATGSETRTRRRREGMAPLSAYAKEHGVKYFLISFVDLFGTVRAKIVPATAIDTIAKAGAGFAGFATWLDMTPADSDILAMPGDNKVIQLPW